MSILGVPVSILGVPCTCVSSREIKSERIVREKEMVNVCVRV